jgi:uncharacterized glyoxalase superfamily protein PhnB
MTTTRSSAIPCLRYRDAPAAIEWLCRVFGFEKHLIVPLEGGRIAHAQLVHGAGMIMLGSTSQENAYGELVKLPSEVGGAQTQTVYLVVPDADAVHARANEAGAKITLEIKDEDYGGRGFSCYDLEGHLWSIGTYDPWAEEV